MVELSVVIPAYNEERRLPATLDLICNFLSRRKTAFEIVVVDDGSTDGTADVVLAYAKNYPQVRLVSYQPNRGKGFAVRTGMLAAKGDFVLLDDADSSSPIDELTRLEQAIAGGADLAIGSRAKPDVSRKVDALVHRKFIGNTFNFIVQSLLLPGLYDTQCGFKLFKRQVARDLFSVNRIDGFGFDVEVLYIAKTRGYRIAEVAINWANMEGSKVNVLFDSPKMLIDVMSVVVASWMGRYRKTERSRLSHEGLIGVSDRDRDDQV